MGAYQNRVIEAELRLALSALGGVLIEGPRACGKTMTAQRSANTVFRFDEDEDARIAAETHPAALFDQPTPILFDEWQLAPNIWDRARRRIDDVGQPGQVILTGSALQSEAARHHPGTGRIGMIRMRPMSFVESGHSTGAVSLAALFDTKAAEGTGITLDVPQLLQRIVIGGWPSLLGATEQTARRWLRDYLDRVVKSDLKALGVRPNQQYVRRSLQALARSVAQPVKLTELAKDVGGEAGPVDVGTVRSILDALDKLMLLEDLDAWQPHMRSRTRLRTAAVRHFVDPSLATAALGVGSEQLLKDLSAAGLLFESLAIRDLRVYAQAIDGEVSAWRDGNGNEVDAIVTLRDGRWGALEVKLNPMQQDVAAHQLQSFARKVDSERHGTPAFLAVLTSGKLAYRRPDGVDVIPLTALGP